MTDAVMLRQTAFGDDPTEHVTLFLGDGPDAEQSNQWISAQVATDMPPLKSLALLRIKSPDRNARSNRCRNPAPVSAL
jgi:hypothetical protein